MRKRITDIISSTRTLAFLVLAWLVYYVSTAVWGREAFSGYVALLAGNVVAQALYILFLVCLTGVTVRHARERWLESRMRFALWVALPAGVIIYLAGFFMSSALRVDGKMAVGEGDTITPPWGDTSFVIERLDHGLEERATDTGSGIFQYAPKMTVSLQNGRTAEVGAFPPARIGGSYYHILYVNLAPSISVTGAGGEIHKEGLMALRLFPPGIMADFELEGMPYVFSVRMLPNEERQKGEQKIRIYQMNKPLYEVRIVKGDHIVFEGDSSRPILFDGMTLAFGKPSYWALLEAARDPGLPAIVLGLVLISAGLVLMPVAMMIRLRRRMKDSAD